MGKYMRKGKVSGEVAVMEVPGGALLGVRTRSRTLALQKAQRPLDKGEADQTEASGEYLELRSRRLEKPPHKDPAAPATTPKRGAGRKTSTAAAPALADDDVEASFGDNVLDFDAMERFCRCHMLAPIILRSFPAVSSASKGGASSCMHFQFW